MGWLVKGMERYNYYYELIEEFHNSEAGKAAMIWQRSSWSKSPLFPIKKRRLDEENSEGATVTAK